MGTVWDRLFKFPTEKKAAPVAQDREGRSRYATFTDCVEEYKNHVLYGACFWLEPVPRGVALKVEHVRLSVTVWHQQSDGVLCKV